MTKPIVSMLAAIVWILPVAAQMSPLDTGQIGGGPPGANVHVITADPSDPNVLYANASGYLYRTDDRGARWKPILRLHGSSRARVVIDPQRHTTIYVGAVGGRSTDKGETWEFAVLGEITFAEELAIDPKNSNVMYATTSGMPGIAKTTDGGRTWRKVFDQQVFISSIVVHPLNSEIVFATTGPWGAGQTSPGILRSTDGGASWSEAGGPMSGFHVTALAIDPGNVSDVYAGTKTSTASPRLAPGGLFKSADGGSTWVPVPADRRQLSTLYGVSSIAIDRVRPGAVYVVAANGNMFGSDDSGNTWRSLDPNSVSVWNNVQVNEIAVSSGDDTGLFAAAWGLGVLRTLDGGQNWEVANSGVVAADIQLLGTFGSLQNVVMAGTRMSGSFISRDKGRSWKHLRFDETPRVVNQIVSIPGHPSTVLAATAMNGIQISSDGGVTWTAVNSAPFVAIGNVGASVQLLAVDPVEPSTWYAAGGGTGKLHKTTDAGASWRELPSSPPQIPAVVAVDPLNSQTILAGTTNRGLFRSVDGGQSWTLMTAGLPEYTNYQAIRFDRANAGTVLAGTNHDGLFESRDSGESWQPRNAGLVGMRVQALVTHEDDPAVVYAGTNKGVFKSADGGSTWSAASIGLGIETYIYSLAGDPQDPLTLYAGTSGKGVYVSQDGARTWSPAGVHYVSE